MGKTMPQILEEAGVDWMSELLDQVPPVRTTGVLKQPICEPTLSPKKTNNPPAKTIGGSDYSLSLTDFLQEISPDFKLPDSLSFMKTQSIGTLNLLLKLVKELYTVSKENITDIGSAFIYVINFYIGSKNSKNWAELSVGFAALCLSLFKLDGVKGASAHIQRIVRVFFKDLKKYFLKAESAEEGIKSFWSDITVTNPRSLFGMVHACSGILTSVLCIKSFIDKSFEENDITQVIMEVSQGIFKIGSEVRQHAENISIFLSRVYDWVMINAEALMKLQFDKIRWELPSEQVFESKYVDLIAILNSAERDPLYLEANNLTYAVLRDRLYKLRISGESELNKNPAPSVKAAIARYLLVIDDKVSLVELRLHPDNTKPQPMSVTLIGSAGCGKSSASDKIGMMMQALAGLTPDESLINNRGGDPKFEENITSSTDVIIYDDYANDQSKILETKEILDIVNTTKEIIPKANASEKGKYKYSNSGTIFTTNDDDVGISRFKTASIDSLLRRLGICLFLSIAEQYTVPGTDRLDLNHPEVEGSEFNTDVYRVAIKKPRGIIYDALGHAHVDYEDIPYPRSSSNNEWRDAVLKLQLLLQADWKASVTRHEKSKLKTNFCSHCSLPFDMCLCQLIPPVTEEVEEVYDETCYSGKSLGPSGIRAESLPKNRAYSPNLFFNKPVATAQQKFWALDHKVLDFSSFLAAKVSLYIFYKNIALYFFERLSFYATNYLTFITLLCITCLIPFGPVFYIGAIFAWEYRYLKTAQEERFERDLELGVAIVESQKIRYAVYGVTFLTGALTLTAMFTSLITLSKVVLKSEEVTVVHPAIEEDVFVPKDEEIKFSSPKERTNSDIIGHYITHPRPAHEAKSARPGDMIGAVGKGIAEVKVITGTSESTVKCLPFGSERLIPKHALPSAGLMDVILSATGITADYKNLEVPQTHVSVLTKNYLLTSKSLDAALVHLPNVPPGKDFSRYLAEPGTLPNVAGCIYLHKNCQTGLVKEIGVRARLMSKPIRYHTAEGIETQYVYECEAENHLSSDGDCGQPLIYKNTIIGIHIAGDGSNKWYCLAIDRQTVEQANRILKQESSIFVASHPSDPVFKNNLKGLHIVDEPTTYVNDVLNTPTTPIVSLGTVLDANMALYKPRASDYYFRDGNRQIEEEFGELSSRPPKFVNGVKQINTTLEKFNTPKMEVPIALMDRAVTDYHGGKTSTGESLRGYAKSLQKANPGFFSVRPLQQALDGDQTGVVRGMNNNTSSGCCYGGKKTKHMLLTPLGDVVLPRQLNDYLESDVLTLENEWRSGRGTFDPFVRASKTNEVLPLKKAYEKTRSVYGNDMAFFIAATRGIIPLKHVLRNMELSECYVGLAAQSTAWSDLHQHITRDGLYTNFVCGDFSGYDTQLPKALLEKAAALTLQIYRENGAPESDIEYLRGFLSSVVSPAMIWEGNLLQFCSGQPSGQPLTVEMNSIVNSILIRMAFFVIMDAEYPQYVDPNFRDFVRVAVYGDDNLLGVDDRIPLFNHTTVQAVFASWGIKYTMADKDADSVPYQTIDEVSFLKRCFRTHPELDAIVAPIEEESLSKKIYWWTKSMNTPLDFPEQFSANFESQAREAYLHGVDFYVEFCAKCERIVKASQEGDERFILPWQTIQPVTPLRMKKMLIDAYHANEEEQPESINIRAESKSVTKIQEDKIECFVPARDSDIYFTTEDSQVQHFTALLQCKCRIRTNIGISNFGEMDMVVQKDDVILSVECKNSIELKHIEKGRAQTLRYSNVMRALYPDRHVIGLLYSPYGVEVVCENDVRHTTTALDEFFGCIGYSQKSL